MWWRNSTKLKYFEILYKMVEDIEAIEKTLNLITAKISDEFYKQLCQEILHDLSNFPDLSEAELASIRSVLLQQGEIG